MRVSARACFADVQTLASIEESGVAEFLEDIQAKLRAGRYRPSPVRRRYIEKTGAYFGVDKRSVKPVSSP
jgi:retron-type reverse transcriptase